MTNSYECRAWRARNFESDSESRLAKWYEARPILRHAEPPSSTGRLVRDLKSPNRTLVRLAVPVLFSLIAEPLTGLVDTAFVARLGSDALAGLGVGTIALSSVFWVFNFLGIGAQTEIAKGEGAGLTQHVRSITSLIIFLGAALGLLVIVVAIPATPLISTVMGASGAIETAASEYMRVRWLGAPAMLVLLGVFGSMRGQHDMMTPLWIALGINGLNVGLDAVLIFGWGAIPAFGIQGAAAASAISQWVGAAAGVLILWRRVGITSHFKIADLRGQFKIGGDLFVRTGMLTLFLVLGTRAATRLGAESGAAHQAIRQAWLFTALFMDAWAVSAQTMVGNAVGAMDTQRARRVASIACWWSLGTGFVLAGLLLGGTGWVQEALVPAAAASQFKNAWWVAMVMLPVSGLTFATDGIHWGTGDFGYLRNATTIATVAAGAVLVTLEMAGWLSLAGIWWLTGLWVAIRAVIGMIRVWPGVGEAPLKLSHAGAR
jgi:MATE family, multidrug efflux pump